MKSFQVEYQPPGFDHWQVLQGFLSELTVNGGVIYFPPGRFNISKTLSENFLRCNIALIGAGENLTSIVLLRGGSALDVSFDQEGARQPYGLTLQGIGFRCTDRCGTAVKITYNNPLSTIDHRQTTTVIRQVAVISNDAGQWTGGFELADTWNVQMSDVFISGCDPLYDEYGLNWESLAGSGLRLSRMCVNAHFSNVKLANWKTGVFYHHDDGGNTEGLFFSNCSMVAVNRGMWIIGNPNSSAPRVSTLTWTGGMIECRVGRVVSGSAAFHLVNVWTALITGCQFITETIPSTHITYAIFLDNSCGVVVNSCDLNAWHYGVYTVGFCKAVSVHGNTQTNLGTTACFNGGTNRSRAFGNVAFNGEVTYQDWAEVNYVESATL